MLKYSLDPDSGFFWVRQCCGAGAGRSRYFLAGAGTGSGSTIDDHQERPPEPEPVKNGPAPQHWGPDSDFWPDPDAMNMNPKD